MHLLVDETYPNSNGYIAFATSPEKVAFNIAAISPLQEKINEQWAKGNDAIPIMVTHGRWIVICLSGTKGRVGVIQHFVDFRTDLEWLQSEGIFSIDVLGGILKLQDGYAKSFDKTMDTVELVYNDEKQETKT